MGKTLPVVWAEEAVRDAVRRVARALQTVDKDALLLGKLGVTTQDLWCLVDAGRATLGQADAVSDAVASAHLSGVDLPADWVETLGKVASGEVTADDAVQAVVDGSLRDQIVAELATHSYLGSDSCDCGTWRADKLWDVAWNDQWRMHVAESIVDFRVAPMLAAKDRDVEQIRIRLAQTLNLSHSRTLDQLIDDVSEVFSGWVRMAREIGGLRRERDEALRERDILAADAMQLDVEMAQLRRDLERAVAIREQATGDRDEAVKALGEAGDVVGAQRADIERLRAERDEAREYVERLVLAARGDWPSWGDDVPAAFMEAELHIDGLRARPTVHAYEAACEALEKRRVALANAIQHETASFYDAVDEVQAMRAELDAVKANAITPPSNWTARVANHFPGDYGLRGLIAEINSWRGVPSDQVSLDAEIESWRGQPDTEATEQPADEYWCGTCKETFSPLDHYHCVKCKALTGMTGHPNGCPTPYGPAPMVPRVWRKGDEPPPLDVKKVRHDNSQVFTRVGPNGWRAGAGPVITGEQLIDRYRRLQADRGHRGRHPVTALPEPTVYEVDIPLMRPPLSRWTGPKAGLSEPLNANTTYHRYERSARVRAVREAVLLRAKQARIPKARHLTVQLHYAPGDNRRRDSDNLYPTFKAACDALARGPRRDWVGLELVPDDTPEYMTKLAPLIHPGKGDRRLWLTIEVGILDAESGTRP
jgi:crossover junction endodeoxyribonuclease RusA